MGEAGEKVRREDGGASSYSSSIPERYVTLWDDVGNIKEIRSNIVLFFPSACGDITAGLGAMMSLLFKNVVVHGELDFGNFRQLSTLLIFKH